MQRDTSGIPSFLDGGRPTQEFESPGPLLFLSLLFLQGGGMDLSRVGEKLLSSVRSARSLGLLPPASDRPEDFDPVRHILENIPSEENDVTYFDQKSTLRLAQLDRIAEQLSQHVMEHHEEMVKGMQLVMELEQDLKVANVICMNGRRHIALSMQEVSRDLVVNSHSKKKQALLDMLPILTELRRALDMQMELEALVENGNYFQAFQLLPEYLQVLENYSELSAIQEMGLGVEAWLGRTIQKLDSHLLGVCQMFKEESYITAVDAYALMGDVAGLAEKIQSFYMQEVLSRTHSVLKDVVQEEIGNTMQRSRFTYSDLCVQIPESKFRQCLLKTLDTLFKLMCSYYSIMSFRLEEKDFEPQALNYELKKSNTSQCLEGIVVDLESRVSSNSVVRNEFKSESVPKMEDFDSTNSSSVVGVSENLGSTSSNSCTSSTERSDVETATARSDSPFYKLRKDTTAFVAHTLERGRKNLWQLITSRLSVLLSCSAICSTSNYQFLRNYEDLNVFILAGEAFCGVEAADFRQKLKVVCENYVAAFHRQNVYALKMVLEKESWVKMPAEALQVISLAGLIGDGAPLIVPSVGNANISSALHSKKMYDPTFTGKQNNGFACWLKSENLFSSKLASGSKESPKAHLLFNGSMASDLADGHAVDLLHNNSMSAKGHSGINGSSSLMEDENEDLLADFIDEDSQLPSRISKSRPARKNFANWNDEEVSAQTGSSLCLLRLMDKYARLMQKLEIVNVEFFKGICHLFGIFYLHTFETFGQQDINQSGKSLPDTLSSRLKTALSKIMQDYDMWIRPQNVACSPSSPMSLNTAFTHMDVMPTIPPSTMFGQAPSTSFGLKERCAGAETISLVARLLYRSRTHLQSMLLQHNATMVEDFFGNLVDSVPDLSEHIYRTTAHLLLHINGYADRIANAKWEVKELGLEHNGYVDLLLGEFKHYRTRLAHGGISKEVQDLLLEYGLENVAEVLIEGLSRVKRCTDEGRALMLLDLQVLINGLQHFVSINVKPKLQIVETFIKAYYLPETEYVHWARSHLEYSKSQIVGLINLVATMKSWKRKTRLEVLERIETGV
ncbi:syndetin-like isoform X2 [Phoenix dactylifera]|uniref:Syndetin-like isoform X2 n=1 Tax=Phoenix dactylifera TaxID=42345 RepID=A0A8B9A8T2_PHODC|nr:syndetin-like isoform X2 [Phoenix dactylifera]